MKIRNSFIVFIALSILSNLSLCKSEQSVEDRIISKLGSCVHEKDALKILNESIYQKITFTKIAALNMMTERKWLKASKLILDFLLDNKIPLNQEVEKIMEDSKNYIQNIKNVLKNKKKNIVKLSPIFEWSQDNKIVRIRIKFAKNLESPGEKGIQNFKAICQRNTLIVQGYKQHEDYVANYYRSIKLYDMMKPLTCKLYKETEGTYVLRFDKQQQTLYWNHLDLFTEDHHNTYTWFDVFTQYDDKAKYTEFREFANQNLLEKDINEYIQEKFEEKRLRLNKINKLLTYLKTKDYENKNYCNSPVNEKFCYLLDIHDWNYWLS